MTLYIDYSGRNNLTTKMLAELVTQASDEQITGLVFRTGKVSGSVLFGLPREVPVITRLKENLRVVNFSKTGASELSLQCLDECPKLEEAYFEQCPNMLLKQVLPNKTVRKLSLVGSHVLPDCVQSILRTFSNLETLDYMLDLRDQKPLGVTAESLKQVAASTLLVRLQKVDGQFTAVLLDAKRVPVAGDRPVFFDEKTSQFYNESPEQIECRQVSLRLDHTIARDAFWRIEPTSYFEVVRRGVQLGPKEEWLKQPPYAR